MTYAEFEREVDRFRGGLASLGVEAGQRVAIVSDNRVEWAVAAYATYGLGATFVPMYEAQQSEEWHFILRDSEAVAVIASTPEHHARLSGLAADLPDLRHVIGLESGEDDPKSYAALCRVGDTSPVPPQDPDPQSVAGFIYTSGTTGKPKGVILTHRNIATNLAAVREVFPLDPGERSLSFLPWAHSYGQTAELHYIISLGCEMAINDAIPHLVDNLATAKPTVLVAVPRIFNSIYDRVVSQIDHRPAAIRKLFWDGIRAAGKKGRGEHVSWWRNVELAIDDKLIFSKIREKFGGRLKFVISASAALGVEVAEFIHALGIPLYEGYGLSETSPIVSANTPTAHKMGTVGKPIPGVRVEIDKTVTGADSHEGEIIVYGPNVTQGYHNRPDENEHLFTPDGGLRTGDLGSLDEDGFLRITGRLKEQYKLENGKYVMPSPLEETLKYSHYITNVMLYGDNRPHNVALVVPDKEAVHQWAEERGLVIDDMSKSLEVRELLRKEIEAHSADFKGYEKPREFAIVESDFTTSNGMLTPTLKLKRRNVTGKYGELLDSLYR